MTGVGSRSNDLVARKTAIPATQESIMSPVAQRRRALLSFVTPWLPPCFKPSIIGERKNMRQKKPARCGARPAHSALNVRSVAVDGLDDTRHRPRRFETAAHLLENRVNVFLLRLDGG